MTIGKSISRFPNPAQHIVQPPLDKHQGQTRRVSAFQAVRVAWLRVFSAPKHFLSPPKIR